MKIAMVALVLMIGVIVILGIGDALNPLGLGGFTGGQGALLLLLLIIPISLALFFFLVHQQNERLRAEKREEKEE